MTCFRTRSNTLKARLWRTDGIAAPGRLEQFVHPAGVDVAVMGVHGDDSARLEELGGAPLAPKSAGTLASRSTVARWLVALPPSETTATTRPTASPYSGRARLVTSTAPAGTSRKESSLQEKKTGPAAAPREAMMLFSRSTGAPLIRGGM